MMIFSAVSSFDICCGAYRATGAELGSMQEEPQGLFGPQADESQVT
jgi:hypothetical protein